VSVNGGWPDLTELERTARSVRREILTMLHQAGSGHPGGSLSEVELLLGLYGYALRHDPQHPTWPQRDRFVLSKGHGCPALYVVLSHYGYFPKTELATLRRYGSRLQGHPQLGLPGLEIASGSLGQGISVALGMALAGRLDPSTSSGSSSDGSRAESSPSTVLRTQSRAQAEGSRGGAGYRVWCLVGDGECDEGQVWEAAMAAAHHRVENFHVIVDANGVQQNGPTRQVMNSEPLVEKWRAFGWDAREINGHSVREVLQAYDAVRKITGQPSVIVARTVKGKGVSFMEGKPAWHGVAPNTEQLGAALAEIGED